MSMALASRSLGTVFLIVLTLTTLGCHDHPTRGHHHSPLPVVRAIEVFEHDNVGTSLEIEVHLYDAYTGELLGCSGDDNGLSHVNESGVLYRTNAHFVRVGGRHRRLDWHDVEGRDLFVRVYEDDLNRCPNRPGELDDFVGQSPVFYAEELDGRIGMEFDDVGYLELGLRY